MYSPHCPRRNKTVSFPGCLPLRILLIRAPDDRLCLQKRHIVFFQDSRRHFGKLHRADNGIDVVFDQTGTPTYALDLAEAIYDIVENRKYEGNDGVYHFSNEGVCSWFDFTKMIAEYAGNTACDIRPCHSNEFPSKVTRPAYSVLDKTKIKETFGLSIPYWTDSLKKCIKNLQ